MLTLLPIPLQVPKGKRNICLAEESTETTEEKTDRQTDGRVEGILEHRKCMYICEVGRCRLGRCPGTKAFPVV